jgi:hypothetical protein
MPEPMDSATETAKAVQEVAKATGKAIDLVRDIGPFVNKVLGNPIADIAGMAIGDPIHEIRKRNQARLAQNTEA